MKKTPTLADYRDEQGRFRPGNPWHRQPKIGSPAEFEKRATAYFEACASEERRPSVTGLCLALGLSARSSLELYAKRPEFEEVVSWARLVVEHSYEDSLREKGANPAGPIFALKNQGWYDRQELLASIDVTDSWGELVRGLRQRKQEMIEGNIVEGELLPLEPKRIPQENKEG